MSITATDTRQTIPLMVDLLQNHIHYLTLNPLFGNNRSQYSRCVQIIVASLIDYMQSEMCGNHGVFIHLFRLGFISNLFKAADFIFGL